MSRALLLVALLAAACGPRNAGTAVVIPAGTADARHAGYAAVLGGAAVVSYSDANEPAAREMRAMAPVFARGRPIPLPFEPPAKGWAARAWTYHGRDYLVLVSLTKDRQWRVPEEALKPYWRPLFEARRDPRELLKEHKGSYYLKPYQVLVLESRLRPKRLLGR